MIPNTRYNGKAMVERRKPRALSWRAGIISRPLIILVLLLCASPVLSQQVWTLDTILARVRSGNPALQAYDYQAEALNAYAEGAQSWMAPMVGAGTFMSPYPGSGVEQGGEGMFMLSAEQAIPNPAKLRAKEAYMASKPDIVAAAKGQAYNELRAEARGVYYEWVVLEKKRAVLQENLRLMQTLLQLAEIRYPYNQGSLGSIYKAEGRLHEIENLLLMNRHDITERNIALNTLMNIPEDTRYRIDTSRRHFGHMLAGVDTAYLLDHRSDLQQVQHSISSLRLGIALEKTQRKPEFSIRYEHMMPYNGLMENQYTLMGMVSIPIAPWSSKAYKANIAGKQLEIEALETKQEAILNKAQGAVASTRHHYHIMRQQLDNYNQKIIPALRKNYETTLLAYEQNTGDLAMVIDAWEALNAAQMQYLDQLGMFYENIVDYEKVLER